MLFVGNSLTYENDLPATVKVLAESGGKRFTYKTVAFPNFSLEDHWNQSHARRALASSRWDFVVLQQGPSASPEGLEVLLKYTKLFSEEIRRAGARPALYMVWPSAARFGDFGKVIENHAMAARQAGCVLIPAGEAWRAALRRDPHLPLYTSDGFHPSPEGSYLVALLIYARLFGSQPPVAAPPPAQSALTRRGVRLTPAQAETISGALAEVTQGGADKQ
ncbi:MAG TPA: SGNH/GDSL hydrolase family protein [Pyrinomonadaceae bacterium]